MFSTKEAMELAADWAAASGDLRNAIEAACDRIEYLEDALAQTDEEYKKERARLERENAAMAKLVSDADLPGLERDHNADLHEMVRIRAENDKFRKALTAIGKCSLDYCKIKQCDGPCAHKDARAALAPATSKETP